MDRVIRTIITLAVGASIIIAVGYKTQQHCARATNATKRVEIPSPKEFQALLNELEPDSPIAEDGIIGKETIAKWERVYNNQQAIKTFKKGR